MLEQLQLIPTLRARWLQVLLVWAGIVAAALALSLALPTPYRAAAEVVVVTGADPTALQAQLRPTDSIPAYMATQADIVRSEAVALRVLRDLGLEKQPEWLDKWHHATEGRGNFESWLAGQLLRKLAVQPSRESNVLRLTYTSPDPDFSAAVANAFVKAYIETTVQMQVVPARQFNVFFEERARPLRDALESAKARLSAYEKEHGLILNDERDVESTRLAELTSQRVALEDELAGAANRRRQAAAAPTSIQELRGDPEVASLAGELANQERRLTEFRSGLGEKHPAVIEVRESVAKLRGRIEASMRRGAASYEVPWKVAQARLAEVRAAIDHQRAVVLQRKSQRDAAAALLRDVHNAQTAYDAVLSRASETALASAKTTQPNISVLKSATPPPSPWPLLPVNVAIAAVLGLLLGVAHALFAERRDRRLRTAEDVTRWLQQPMLLMLPDGYARRSEGERRSVEKQQRLVRVHRRLLPAPR